MTRQSEAGDARGTAREGVNLRQQYRPIGIGAVAAAVTVTGRPAVSRREVAANDRDERRPREPKAA
jgi:hypothetical protein